MTTTPRGPASLYWQTFADGARACRAGAPHRACPYPPGAREFSRLAWFDGWTAAARNIGLALPADAPVDEGSA